MRAGFVSGRNGGGAIAVEAQVGYEVLVVAGECGEEAVAVGDHVGGLDQEGMVVVGHQGGEVLGIGFRGTLYEALIVPDERDPAGGGAVSGVVVLGGVELYGVQVGRAGQEAVGGCGGVEVGVVEVALAAGNRG